jgi:hypothetical protein
VKVKDAVAGEKGGTGEDSPASNPFATGEFDGVDSFERDDLFCEMAIGTGDAYGDEEALPLDGEESVLACF